MGLDYRLIYIPVSMIINYWHVTYRLYLTVAPKNTNIVLGLHFEKFLADQIETGRYASESEVIRAGLHLLEEREAKLQALLKNTEPP